MHNAQQHQRHHHYHHQLQQQQQGTTAVTTKTINYRDNSRNNGLNENRATATSASTTSSKHLGRKEQTNNKNLSCEFVLTTSNATAEVTTL